MVQSESGCAYILSILSISSPIRLICSAFPSPLLSLLFIYSTFALLPIKVLAKPISATQVPRSNPLGIDWSPAPPPENGPPFSAAASRNKELLPAQIGGIVGAYLFSLCVVGILIITLGRRLRRQLELDARALEVELVDAAYGGINTGSSGPTPLTPANLRNFSWPSPDKKYFAPGINPDPSAFVFPPIHTSYETSYVYPTQRQHSIHQSVYSHQSNLSIDNKVVEADREMMNRNLEDLYAHVMEQEEAKAAGVDVRSMPPPKVPGEVSATALQKPQSKKFGQHKPSEINTNDNISTKTHSRASSIISALTSPRSAPKSPKSPRRKGIRGLRISSPMATPHSTTFSHAASDEEPLTPREYVHRAPPPIPKNQLPYGSTSANGESPTRSIAETLETISPVSPQRSLPSLNTRNLQISLKSEMNTASPQSATSDRTRTMFSRPLRSTSSKLSLPNNPKISNSSSTSPDSPSSSTVIGSTSTNNTQTTSAVNPTRSLPFREQFQQNMLSPTLPTKMTVLERVPRDNGQKTGGLKTPFSGGTVPYSPYQPFTPMMPITPRLVTKEDRKKMKKAMPRTPVVELIKSEEEIWDSGY
ncbi:91776207-d2e5-4284-aa1d-a2ceea7977e6-CDS [Sclerotinia trifoliorum]|uniref:91776207-d2e5-4284-aa1d-a2ceea7977e6-CDS n=1 Tax=Sclerotinia trifoliorum TaxID=28548 RepID=A0A8H2VML9_9HELO|nr:91776207-d2e5-4284-aa1d-a2ceea7977e6-CDS [Sclerotinia trifoliorum]